jgi:hypothetical protein
VVKERLPAELERLVQPLAEQPPPTPTAARGASGESRGEAGGHQERPCRGARTDPRRAAMFGLGSVSFLRS